MPAAQAQAWRELSAKQVMACLRRWLQAKRKTTPRLLPDCWVTGQTPDGMRPATVSFERACGRVLFSTYHTEPSTDPSLKAQELALLYVLLEVSVCNESPTGTVPGPR